MAKEWRRGRDSNPRYGFTPYNGLANPPVSPCAPAVEQQKADVSALGTVRSKRFVRELPHLAKAQESAHP